MPREFLTDDEVEREIERLPKSEAVKLARREQYIRNRRRQRMYMLKTLEKRGKKLMAEGVTMEVLDIMAAQIDTEETTD